MGDKPFATSPPYGGQVPQYPPPPPEYERTQQYPPPPPEYERTPQYPPPPTGYQQAPAPAAGVPVASGMVIAQTRIPFVSGVAPPAPPPGFAYVLKEECSVCAIVLAILFFPWGLLFLLCMREQYWLLVPVS